MTTLGKPSRRLRRTLMAIVIFALSFILHPAYFFPDFFNFKLYALLLVVFLFSALENSLIWGLIFGNSLNSGLVLGAHFFIGYPGSPSQHIVVYLIVGGLFWGFAYFLATALFGGLLANARANLSKCSDCGKRAPTLYCQVCGKKGCVRCMKQLFNILYKGDKSSKVEVGVCSEKCWSDFLNDIIAHVDRVTTEVWTEDKTRYAVNGPYVGRILVSSYARHVGENPNNPHKQRTDSWFGKSADQTVDPSTFHITWFYNHYKYKENKPPYYDWFSYNAQDLFYEHNLEPEYIGRHDRDESRQDYSVRLFNELRTRISSKKAEFFDPYLKIEDEEYQTWDYEEIDRRIEKKRERARKKGWWKKLMDEIDGTARDERLRQRLRVGICDYCSRDLRDEFYYTCRFCEQVFCSQKCSYGHERDAHA